MYGLYNSKKEALFGNILGNRYDAIHKIGMHIANNCYLMPKGDIHSAGEGFDYKQFISNPEYDNRNTFYFLDQRHVLKHFLDMWSGSTFNDQMKPTTTSDRLRAISLLFQAEMREYISFILSRTDRSIRRTIDEWTGKQNGFHNQLNLRFIDPEYGIAFPPKWFLEHTKQKINDKFDSTPGKPWDDFINEFDPNGPARIVLPRTESFFKHIAGPTISVYDTVMVDIPKTEGVVMVMTQLFQYGKKRRYRYFEL